MTRWIAGLDGCRGAWAGILLDLDDPSRYRAGLFPTIAEILDGPEAPICVGIDVPIGLPDRIEGGGRVADIAARSYLAGGRASVFPVPPRAAIHAASYEEAKALSRAHSEPPFAPSIQCWNITRYIREADRLLIERPTLRDRLHEVHPEVAFRRLNGDRPLFFPKKGAGRQAGLSERRALLLGAGLPASVLLDEARPRGVGADDHLDALAALVVARDIVLGHAIPMPDPPGRDRHGLPVVIWAPAGQAPVPC